VVLVADITGEGERLRPGCQRLDAAAKLMRVAGEQSCGGRRAPLPLSPLRGEPLRTGLVDALAVRFDVPVMAVVEGAEYGMTTALTQAIRANDTAPRGIDA
jgi:hypothetical protein